MKDNGYRQLQWSSDLVQRFWDWQSQFPETYFTYQFGGPIIAHLATHLGQPERVLDYGCGTGFLLPHLAGVASSVTGADYSPASVAEANRVHGALPNFEGAFVIDELVAADRKFDAIVCVEVVEHLYDPQLDALLENIRRLAAPQARIVFTTPNDERLEANQVFCPVSDVVFHRWQHVRSWNSVSLPEHLDARGFDPIATLTTNLAEAPARGWRGAARSLKRRLCGGDPGTPHLVCVTRLGG